MRTPNKEPRRNNLGTATVFAQQKWGCPPPGSGGHSPVALGTHATNSHGEGPGLELGKYGLFPLTLEEQDKVVADVQGWFADWCAAPAYYVDLPLLSEKHPPPGADRRPEHAGGRRRNQGPLGRRDRPRPGLRVRQVGGVWNLRDQRRLRGRARFSTPRRRPDVGRGKGAPRTRDPQGESRPGSRVPGEPSGEVREEDAGGSSGAARPGPDRQDHPPS